MRLKEGNVHNRHKTSYYKQAEEVIRISDIVLMILDGRFIEQSRIPEMETEVVKQGKILVHIVNKADLMDKKEPNLQGLSNPILVSSKTRQGISKLRERIQILASKVKTFDRVHVGVIGYPNTGKSSLLNILARKGAAPVSSEPGFTKGLRKIRFAKGILLLDAPGMIPSNENLFGDDQMKHSMLGAKSTDHIKDPDMVVNEIMKLNPGKLEKHYKISEEGDVETLLEELGKKWGILKKKGEIDSERTARKILKEWNSGKIN
ncbi:50S ribosome-binding GTPase [Candidatus Pacearchaeota archaeon]|nr:50S ribosome-binding GTPase [Candidatus Pacearchaeota archaeon]